VLHEQVQIEKNFQNMIQEKASKPVETTKSDNKEFRYDAKEESRNKYKGSDNKRNKSRDTNKSKETINKAKPGGIDILI
ncbi:MAG: hypothetical protein QM222_09340, partial [Bacillota bacterium]|nr:hypothetical protein [Bacillota bacterium]